MAPSIEAVVSQKIMPPWFADPKSGHFSNNRSLPQKDIATLVPWANNGAIEGDPKDMPPPAEFPEGWGIPSPTSSSNSPSHLTFRRAADRAYPIHDRSHRLQRR